ncbi:MAG: tyrosine-protein phosphatase [Candidatus Sericytochromatia bacterium]|nr:tyrosine-protein phosphatase [Candidatus Sericytochromatia bacterium]
MCINIKSGVTITETSSQAKKTIDHKDDSSVISEIKPFSVDKAKISSVTSSTSISATPLSHISFFDTLKHNVLEVAGSMAVTLGKVPIINKTGYLVYGKLTEPHNEADEKYKDKAMGNIGFLTPNLLRGSQPREDDFSKLKKMGVNTIINLRPEENWEKPMIEKSGMKEIYLPIPAVGKPSNNQALQFLSEVTDPTNGKVFFHCLHGADRTGAMAAAYRIAAQGWTVDQAITEMPKYNFHDGFEDAKIYFVKDFGSYWKDLPQQEKNKILHK